MTLTEYTDTKRYLVQQLQAAIAGSDRDSERIMTSRLHGGIGEERREAIKAAFNQDVGELHPHLERRAAALSRQAARALETRGAQEARQMTRILEAQRDRIEKQHEKAVGDQQLTLGFSRQEERQFAANQKHWATRLQTLEDEIRDEPVRIRAGYEVRARRVEPVGLVYLWPVSS